MPFGPGSPWAPFPLLFPVFPDFPGSPMGPREPFSSFGPLLPPGHVAPLGPGNLGGLQDNLVPRELFPGFGGKSALRTRLPAGQTFSLDLQYLSSISCSNCLMISFLTSCIVMLTEVSFKTCIDEERGETDVFAG